MGPQKVVVRAVVGNIVIVLTLRGSAGVRLVSFKAQLCSCTIRVSEPETLAAEWSGARMVVGVSYAYGKEEVCFAASYTPMAPSLS